MQSQAAVALAIGHVQNKGPAGVRTRAPTP